MGTVPQRQERPSITAILANGIIDAIVVVGGIAIIALPFSMLFRILGSIFLFIALIGGLLVGMRVLIDLLEREFTQYVLTDRLIIERGIISHQRIVIPFDTSAIQRVTASQTFLGRLVGYGHVGILTAGWGLVQLRFVVNPYAWQEDILRNIRVSAIVAPITSPKVGAPLSLPNPQIVIGKPRYLMLTAAALISLVCILVLFVGAGSLTISNPRQTPSPGILVLPGITGADILKSIWWLYQIPTIFWTVNAIVVANIVLFLIESIGKRRR